jgi:hypothetical protein
LLQPVRGERDVVIVGLGIAGSSGTSSTGEAISRPASGSM